MELNIELQEAAALNVGSLSYELVKTQKEAYNSSEGSGNEKTPLTGTNQKLAQMNMDTLDCGIFWL